MLTGQRTQRHTHSNNGDAGTDKLSPSALAISLPKGGGATRSIGEKFTANPVTGTGTMSVPIAISPGRSGFGPQLSLSYDSGAGAVTFKGSVPSLAHLSMRKREIREQGGAQ